MEYWNNRDINDLPNEKWKDISGYEGSYMVSSMGRIKNLDENRIMPQSQTPKGYNCVKLKKDNERISFRVHRLVAIAFIPNPECKPTVDHINTIKSDNRVENLRWFTYGEQVSENEITKERVKENLENLQEFHKENNYQIVKENLKKAQDKNKLNGYKQSKENLKKAQDKNKLDGYSFTDENLKKARNALKELDHAPNKENLKKALEVQKKDNYRVNKENLKKATEAVKRKVRCINTGEIFNSVKDASDKYNRESCNICNACNGKSKYCGKHPVTGEKLKWEYVEKE